MHRTCVPIRTAAVPRCLVGRPRRLRAAPLRRQTIRATGSDPPPAEGRNWNPFKEDPAKQEAAKRAVQEAMGGQKDVLADFDGSGGDGDDIGDDGDEGWDEWTWDDIRNEFLDFRRALFEWLAGVGRAIKAIFYFFMGIVCVSLIIPTLLAAVTFIRVLLRLEKAEDVYGTGGTEPAGMQRSVLFSDDEQETEAKSKEEQETEAKSKEEQETEAKSKEQETASLTERQRRSRKRREKQKQSKSDEENEKS